VAVKLSQSAYRYARELVQDRRVVADERDDWSEHRPSTEQENAFIEEHGIREYAKWHLGVDDSKSQGAKTRYKFPYGDFESIHRCAVISAEVRASQNDYRDIQSAAAHLHGMIEAIARV
jgi:hypothetical protein